MIDDEHSERLFPAVHRSPISTLVITLSSVSFVWAITYLGKGHPVYDWINDWQTLLTGVGAIFAAYITVRQLRHSDRLQQKMHMQTLSLQRKSDALLISREIPTIINEIRMKSLVVTFAVKGHMLLLDTHSSYQGDREDLEKIRLRTDEAKTALGSDAFKPILHLVDGELLKSATAAIERAGHICSFCRYSFDLKSWDEDQIKTIMPDTLEHFATNNPSKFAFEQLDMFNDATDKVIAQLERLQKSYHADI